VNDRRWLVAGTDIGLRLDKFLAAADRLGSRGRALDAIKRRKVFLNDSEVSGAQAARALQGGDAVRLWMDRPGSSKPRERAVEIGDLRVLYEDEALLVLDKPAGLLAVPLARKSAAPSALAQLERHFRARGKRRGPFVVHRIDRDTSGILVFAKNLEAQEQLKEQFRRRTPTRVYVAVVYGHPAPPAGIWRDHLVWDRSALIQKETHPRDPRGKEAVSAYRVLETLDNASLIEVSLRTGKRNQIRIQARLRGHTLVGEERYIYGPDILRPIDFPRQALHAQRLGLCHPVSGDPIDFESPLPPDLVALIARLRSRAPAAPPTARRRR
jgi:23S rRNA pseudouridine1911/1915/1917 synthase